MSRCGWTAKESWRAGGPAERPRGCSSEKGRGQAELCGPADRLLLRGSLGFEKQLNLLHKTAWTNCFAPISPKRDKPVLVQEIKKKVLLFTVQLFITAKDEKPCKCLLIVD